jgi:hypothetical protein
MNVEQGREDHPDLDRKREVSEDRQRERDEPDADIRLGQLQQLWDLVPLPHVVGDDEQNRRQHRHRDETRQRRGDEQDHEQGHSVEHARDGSAGAGSDVGRCPGDGAGGR